jgi:tRNA(fMet)-specific endonuclease VapC
MLDTNMVSYILKGKSPAARGRLASLEKGAIACISAVTEAELLYGIAKSDAGDQRREQCKKSLDWFLARLNVEPWGREEAAAYGQLRARQERLGKRLGAPHMQIDTQIAAHAIALGAVLITNDNGFRHVPDLPGIENWATEL